MPDYLVLVIQLQGKGTLHVFKGAIFFKVVSYSRIKPTWLDMILNALIKSYLGAHIPVSALLFHTWRQKNPQLLTQARAQVILQYPARKQA